MTVAGTRAIEAARSNQKAAKRAAFFRSVHDKTNILVVNGTERVHSLVSQTMSALGKDSSVRDAQQNSAEVRELKDRLDRVTRELKDRQIQIDELRKATADYEAKRVKTELELKLLKGQPQTR